MRDSILNSNQYDLKIWPESVMTFLSVEIDMESAENSDEDVKAGIFKMPVTAPSLTIKQKSVEVARVFSDGDIDKLDTTPDVSNNGENCTSDHHSSAKTDNTVVNKNMTGSIKHKSSSKAFSPAEQLKDSETVIPYKEPSWGGVTDKSYYFEVIKNGAMADRVDLTDKSYYVFGRLPSCDHSMDHPSLSRYHAVIQHCAKTNSEDFDIGWYLYDLDSTHGTWINKSKVSPHAFHRLRVGYVIKFGGSTRLYILQVCDLVAVLR